MLFISEIERQERQEKFIQKAIIRHSDKFDYSKTHYINNRTKITIICNKHGEFQKVPLKHLQHKYSCPVCAKIGYSESIIKNNKQEFLKKAKALYGDKYSYDKVVIRKKDDKIKIYCKKHKSYFEQRLNVFLDGRIGCKKCLTEIKKDFAHNIFKKKFVEKFTKKFGNQYDFSKVQYTNNTTPVLIKCLKHDLEFYQTPANIHRFKNCSCPKCKKMNNI